MMSNEDISNGAADAAELKQAWDDMIGLMQQARDALDDPQLLPAPATSRNLAEGYRYLAGFFHHAIERAFHEDPDFPAFRNALSMFNKSTIENSDAIYFYAPIDGRKSYLIEGQVADHSHWGGGKRAETGRKAPQYLIFEVTNGPMAGDTGDLRELMPGTRSGFGLLDSSTLKVGENGELEILCAPEKPADWNGNFFCTRKGPKHNAPDGDDRYAEYISGRQLFYDWTNEDAIPLTITPLDNRGDHPPALTIEKSKAQLKRMGTLIKSHMRFWNKFYDVLLDCNQTQQAKGGEGRYFMPVNGYNKPNAASSDTGGGMSTNVYAGGIYDLAPDEALYVEATYTGDPVYVSIHLGNLWGESPDYANHQSSLNLHQMYMGADNIQRWIISHSDPGVQNWVDTTGLPRGYLSHRWAYSEIPPEDKWPNISAKLIKLSEVDDHIPADMPRINEQQRKDVIHERQQHVQRRYRAF